MPLSSDTFRVSSSAEYVHLVGRRVELVGIVTQSKIPQVLGVDVSELENHRGRKVRVTGILRRSDVTQAQIDEEEQLRGGKFANRGPGAFYHLDELWYELKP